ncbi:MAG: cytochrome c, partial [Maribacter sp.]|nr:cytochrome c [Maribacter sp.]
MNHPPSTTSNISSFFVRLKVTSVLSLVAILFIGCESRVRKESWDYEITLENEAQQGVLRFLDNEGSQQVSLVSFNWGTMVLRDVTLSTKELSGNFILFGEEAILDGVFKENDFSGSIVVNGEEFSFTAQKQSEEPVTIDRSNVTNVLTEADLPESEKNIDHAGIIAGADRESYKRGERIYSSNCINCHGNQEVEGSIPLSTKFWEQELKSGNDAYSMYRTITMGSGSMPPQPVLTPQEKYDVISYIRQEFIKENKKVELIASTPGYLINLPKGTSRGPKTKPYQPWADMDYGNFFINTYELVDEETGPERYHSPRPIPYPDEDYLKNNFAYKGIAVRLDEGEGGVSKGKAWMIFDHDLMRVAGGWTGDGFIDWNGILLNDKHETYPRTIGKLHFETPVGPGWANPETGSFVDPRFRARDGRAFGPLPKNWSDYKGLYHHGDKIIISYTVGKSNILEELGREISGKQTVFTRTLNISPSSSLLKMKVAPVTSKVEIIGEGGSLSKEDGFVMMTVQKSRAATVKLFIADSSLPDLVGFVANSVLPEDLNQYTKGGPSHYPEKIKSVITPSLEDKLFAVDQLTPPFDNPWACRMKLSGIDFLNDANNAVACATDGDVWLISGLTDGSSELTWQRIGSGLFQPLGIKVIDDNIYVICRDQLVLRRDYNGDNET